jgi:hypothetical protein
MVGPMVPAKVLFIHLLLAYAEPSAGTIQVRRVSRMGYLRRSRFSFEHTVLDELTRGDRGS